MPKGILHVDLSNLVSKASVVDVESDRLSVKKRRTSVTWGGPCPGALKALGEIEEEGMLSPDRVLVTTTFGGQPRVVCAGVVKGISGESARRAALAGGATVTDVVAVDDGRHDSERISDLRRQDVSLAVLAGGVDENILGSGRHQLFNIGRILAEGLARKGNASVPVVYAASLEGRQEVGRIFGEGAPIVWADNVRATLEQESLESARQAVVDVFSSSIGKTPGYGGFGRLGSPEILPGGHVLGRAFEAIYSKTEQNVVGFSLDGDVVQVFSCINGVFTRTVTGTDRVDPARAIKWVPGNALKSRAKEAVSNLKLRPHLVPSSWEELAFYVAFLKEAMAEALSEHKECAAELRGIHRQRDISETFKVRVESGETLLKPHRIRNVIFTGHVAGLLPDGVLLSLGLDVLPTSGVVGYYRDSSHTLSLAGALGLRNPLENLLGVAAVASGGRARVKSGWASLIKETGTETLPLTPGEIVHFPIEGSGEPRILLKPVGSEDFGEGEGRQVESALGAFSDLYVDCRPRASVDGVEKAGEGVLATWYKNLGVFPDSVLTKWGRGGSR